jgi:hypothetical protein
VERGRDFMKGEDSPKGLPRWVVMLVVKFGGPVVIYALACLFLAVYLWFNPIVF